MSRGKRRVVRGALLAWAAVLLGGCLGGSPAEIPEGKSEYVYRLGPGDSLDIEVYGQEAQTQQATVTPDGFITVELVQQTEEGVPGGWSSPIRVMDMTIAEAAQAIHAELTKILVEPNVTVRLLQSRSARVHVVGEVGAQGPVPYLDRMSLIDAIGEAGGVNWVTARTGSVRVVRGRLTEPVLYEVDLDDLLAADEARDFYLEPGDIVYVPERWVTAFDRFIRQLLAPISVVGGAVREAAGAAVP